MNEFPQFQQTRADRRRAVLEALRQATRNDGSARHLSYARTPTLAGSAGQTTPSPAHGRGRG